MSSRRTKSEPTALHVTPEDVVRAIVPYLPTAHTVVDAGAGTGAISLVLCEDIGRRWEKVIAVEVDPERAAQLDADMQYGNERPSAAAFCAKGDFETWPLEGVGVICSNPPFALAEAWLRRAWAPHRTVAFLVPVGWLRARAHLFEGIGCGDPDVYLLDPRPSFTGGPTDSAELAWCLWGPGRGGRWRTLPWRAVRGRK